MFGFKFLKEAEYQALREEVTRTQRELEDMSWLNLSSDMGGTSDVLIKNFKDMIKRSRLFYTSNPLAGQWVNLTTSFVFGEGVSKPRCKETSIQEAIDELWDDPDNQKACFGFMAQHMLSSKLQVEGNLFFVLFDDDMGKVKIRILNTEEVSDIIRDPEDRMRTNFYKVQKYERKYSFLSDSYVQEAKGYVYYPDVEIFDITEFKIPENKLVDGAKIYHVKINCDINDKFGIPELYRGLDWVKAHKTMAEDVATLVKALSQFAWKKKIKGNSAQVASLAGAMQSKMNLTNIKNSAGQTQIENEAVDLQPVDVKGGGVQMGSDGLRQMKLMICAASGIFEHYYGDPSTGNLATAKSMELPMVKKFRNYQQLWRDIYTSLITHTLNRKVESGVLPGTVDKDFKNRRTIVKPTAEFDIDMDFPPVIEEDLKVWADALKMAKDASLVSDDTAARKFLSILKVEDIEEEMTVIEGEKADKEAKKLEQMQTEAALAGKAPVNGQLPMGNGGQEPIKPVKEAIGTPDKRISMRHVKKNNYVMQRMNGYRKVLAGHFKTLLDDVKESSQVSGEEGKFKINVPQAYEKLNRLTISMQEAAKQYFPVAIQIGEKYTQSVLKDLKENCNILETLYEAGNVRQSLLRKRLEWNETYLNESLEFAMLESLEKTFKESYASELEARAAVSRSLTKFEPRIEQYVGAFWTVQEDAVREAGRGTGLMVNFVGPDDEHDCDGCREAVAGNPWPIDNAPLPGEQECLGRCRHALQIIS